MHAQADEAPRSLCGTKCDMNEWRARRARNDDDTIVDTGEHLFVNIVFRGFYSDPSQAPSLEQYQAQLNWLNQCFSGTNSTLLKVPRTGPYAATGFIGVPNVTFLPRTVVVEETMISSSLIGGTNPLLDIVREYPPIDGVLNVYVALIPGNILGQAELGSNYLLCDSRTIGSPIVPGNREQYSFGGTLIHEMGHAFNMPHPWDNLCATPEFSDMTTQRNPNYNGELFLDGGEWQGQRCNRWYDCAYYKDGDTSQVQPILGLPPYSCWDCNITGGGCTQCDTDRYEMFFNFMDYASDPNSVMFTGEQVKEQRRWLLSSENTTVNLVNDDGTVSPVDSTGDGLSDEALATTIVLIVIAIILVIVLIRFW